MSAKKLNIPYAIIEMNPETVKKESKEGEPIYYGMQRILIYYTM